MSEKNKYIVATLYELWIKDVHNNSEFAKGCDINEKTVRNIKNKTAHTVSTETLLKICAYYSTDLSTFFKKAEERFPELKMNQL